MPNPAEKLSEASHSASMLMTWYQVTLSAIGDAVLVTDREGHVTFMNPVAESLTGWVAGEAHGQQLEDVFRIVNEETRQPVEQPGREGHRDGPRRRPGQPHRTHRPGRDREAHRRQCRTDQGRGTGTSWASSSSSAT